jgi:hypothetical protein
MLESEKSINFFGTCSEVPFAGVWYSLPGNLRLFPRERRRRAHPIVLPLGVKLVKFCAAVFRIEATR